METFGDFLDALVFLFQKAHFALDFEVSGVFLDGRHSLEGETIGISQSLEVFDFRRIWS